MRRFRFRGPSTRMSIRGLAAAAARGAPPNVKRWRREAIRKARQAAFEAILDDFGGRQEDTPDSANDVSKNT